MNVILIDDEEVAVNALKRRVNWRKYGVNEVYIAYSMKQAQGLFREKPIDVMISDIEMPQGSGLDLFEWVKVYYPAVLCVYVTCHPEFEYIPTISRLHLAKICSPVRALRLIQRFHNKKEAVFSY